MKHWSAEFRPRSLCNFGDGGESGGPPSGDTGGDGFGGDPAGSDTSGFFSGVTGGGDPTGGNTGFSGGPQGGDIGFSGGPQGGDTGGGSFPGGGGGFPGGDTGGGSFPGGGGSFPGGDIGGGFPGGDYTGDPGMIAGGPPAGMTPTGGVDFTSQGQGFGPAGPGQSAVYGTDQSSPYGPSTQGGPPSTESQMSPADLNAVLSHAPGFQPPGDPFGAPTNFSPTGIFGQALNPGTINTDMMTPSTLDMQSLSEQGRGWIGGPTTVQPGEAFQGGRGDPANIAPPASIDPSSRSENIAPSQPFGPENAGIFGNFGLIGQAQAADRGTDASIINAAQPQNNFSIANDFQALQSAMTNPVNNPDLAQALQAYEGGPGRLGGDIGPFSGPSPGAQQGFSGVSPAQAATSGPFTGQPSMGQESTQGKGDRGATDVAPTHQALNDPSYGQLPGAQPQAAPSYISTTVGGRPTGDSLPPGWQDTISSQLAGRPPGETTQADTFDSRFGNLPPAQAQPQADTFDSRFGNLPPAQPATPDDFNSRFGDFPETIGRTGEEIMSGRDPSTLGVGREAAPLGLLSMAEPPSGRTGSAPAPFGGGRSSGGQQPFGSSPAGGRSGSSPGGRASSDPGYYNTGGRGIAPGALGAEYGGIYGPGVATGRPGTGTFGVSSREGAYGFYDPATGQYYYR